jgi:hypothetical protein
MKNEKLLDQLASHLGGETLEALRSLRSELGALRGQIDATRQVLRSNQFRSDGDLAEMVLSALHGVERLQ